MINEIPDGNLEVKVGQVSYFPNLQQGCAEWHEKRNGIITASEMDTFISPKTLKPATNEKTRTSLYKLAAERIYPDAEVDNFMSYAMERGHLEEIEMRKVYSEKYAKVDECGFVINHSLGFPIGFSPDGLVGDDGLIEGKSRLPKYQVQTIIEHMAADEPATVIPSEYMLQVQTGLFVTGRKWCDFLSYSNGLNMIAIRCYPLEKYQVAIKAACNTAQDAVCHMLAKYEAAITQDGARVQPVDYIDHHEEIIA